MNRNSLKDGLFVTKKLNDENIYNDVIYNHLGDVIYIPKENEVYNIVHSRGKNYLFEINNLEDKSTSYRHYKYNDKTKKIDLVTTINKEKLESVFIEADDSFIVFSEKRSKNTKNEMYSIKKGKFITPKVDNIEKINHGDNTYFMFEDIDYKKEIDRENHVYGFLDDKGSYKGYIYDYYFHRKYPVNINEEPFFMKYYTLRMQIDRRFKDAILNEIANDESIQLKR